MNILVPVSLNIFLLSCRLCRLVRIIRFVRRRLSVELKVSCFGALALPEKVIVFDRGVLYNETSICDTAVRKVMEDMLFR